MNLSGFALAFLAMVLFGVYMVPRKVCRLGDLQFVVSMCVGAVVTTQIAQFVVHGPELPAITLRGRWLSFSCGPVWTLGMLCYTLSVTRMGLVLATPIKNTTAVLGTVLGLVAFAEWRETDPALALAGSVLVVACAAALARCGERTETRSSLTASGVIFALLAAVGFAAYTIPLKLAMAQNVDNYRLIAYMGLGTLTTSLGLLLGFERSLRPWLGKPLREHLLAALSGGIWAVATIAMAEAIRRLGLAVTWPITNLNTIVTVAVGIIVFREIDLGKHWRTVAIALLCAMTGTLLLGLARI